MREKTERLKRRIAISFKGYIYYTGINLLYRKFVLRNSPVVIYYHRIHKTRNPYNLVPSLSIDLELFDLHIRFLSKKCNIIPLSDVVLYYKGVLKLPPRSVAITIDDGFKDNYDNAYPILKKYGAPATIFLTTNFIDTNMLPWWDFAGYAAKKLEERSINNILGQRRSAPEIVKEAFIAYKRGVISVEELVDKLKRVGDAKRRAILKALEDSMEPELLQIIPRQFLSWAEIKDMSLNKIGFGSHTCSHSILTELTHEEVEREVSLSKGIIEKILGKEVDTLAYPDGMFDKKVIQVVRASGYTAAFQTSRLGVLQNEKMHSLPRKRIGKIQSTTFTGKFAGYSFDSELWGILDRLFLRRARKRNPYSQEQRVSQAKI